MCDLGIRLTSPDYAFMRRRLYRKRKVKEYKNDIGRDEDCLFCMYGYFKPRTTWSRGVVVSVSAYETRGPGSIPRVGTYCQSVFSSSLFWHFKG